MHSKGHISSTEFHCSVLIVVVGTTRRVNMLLVLNSQLLLESEPSVLYFAGKKNWSHSEDLNS